MKKENSNLAEKLTTYLFYLSILFFLIAFNFQDSKTSGWFQQFLPNLGGKSISDITFLDSLTGYAVATQSSDTSYILKTTTGGDNWLIIHRQYFQMTKLQFLNNSTGFACGGYLYKTTDGGYNWSQLNTPAISAENMYVINQDTIWICWSESLAGGVFLTTNGGVSWQVKYSQTSANPSHIYMYNARIGFMDGGGLKKTTNGGDDWISITTRNYITTNRNNNMRTFMNRPKIDYYAYGQSSIYQCEPQEYVDPDYWSYTYKNNVFL